MSTPFFYFKGNHLCRLDQINIHAMRIKEIISEKEYTIPHGLTESEFLALRIYTGRYRHDERQASDCDKYLSNMMTALRKLPRYNGVAYHGGFKEERTLLKVKPGFTFRPKGLGGLIICSNNRNNKTAFLSMSRSEKVALEFATNNRRNTPGVGYLYTINVVKGYNLDELSRDSHFGNQKEIILSRHKHRLRATSSAQIDDNGIYRISFDVEVKDSSA